MSGKSPNAKRAKKSTKPSPPGKAISANTNKGSTALGGNANTTGGSSSSNNNNNKLPDENYLISCDVPTKQFILYLNDLKKMDKKFIVQDLDGTHLLVKLSARDEIERKVEKWTDDNVFSAIEKVGEDLDMS
jgi:Transcription factor TFIIH complex subunit Tfb5